MSEQKPIKITRKDSTDFEIKCENEYWADIDESLLRKLCQFPASYHPIKRKIEHAGSDIKVSAQANH